MATERIEVIEAKFSGLGVSSGIAIGTALCLEHGEGKVYRTPLRSDHQVNLELTRLKKAIAITRDQLEKIKKRIESALSPHHE